MGGGLSNTGSRGECNFIGGGEGNLNEQTYGTIGGGAFNKIYHAGLGNDSSTIVGGNLNTVCGSPNSVILGSGNSLHADNSVWVVAGMSINVSGSGESIGSSNFAAQNIHVTGSTTNDGILKISRRETTPSPAKEGMIIASGSAGASKLYYYNGTQWKALFL